MQKTVSRGGGGGGGGVSSSGSMSTLSEEDSSSYPDESELELGLGLSLGGGGGGGGRARAKPPPDSGRGSWDQYARIFTAKASYSSASSSSSSSPVNEANNNGSCGTKRTAEPSSPPGRSGVSQVVGWPPIRSYRMNSLANHAKSPATEESTSTVDIHKSTKDKNVTKESRGIVKTCFFVKVNMDGIPIGRKVDLNAQSCYQTLAHTLDHMFRLSGKRRSNEEDQVVNAGAGRPVKLLDGSSDFVLTYEDKEGDWMLVGDVPWEMFLSSVRRLRIRRTTEANGLAPRSH